MFLYCMIGVDVGINTFVYHVLKDQARANQNLRQHFPWAKRAGVVAHRTFRPILFPTRPVL